ncbi:MAG: hypothetical protein FWE37_09255 [Spirochaetaceae bacterium]|nr:hypothetical protein [Spirochaetaceae bacterium]
MSYSIELTEAEKRWPIDTPEDIMGIMQSILSRELKIKGFKEPLNPDDSSQMVRFENKRAPIWQLGKVIFDGSYEHFWTLGFNDDRKLRFIDLVAIGNSLESHVLPRMAYRGFSYYIANQVILVHNCLGDLPPDFSEQTKENVINFIRAAKTIGIDVYDYVLITNKLEGMSLKAKGVMKNLKADANFADLTAKEAMGEVKKAKKEVKKAAKENQKQAEEIINKNKNLVKSALTMIRAGLEVEKIAEATGFTVSQVNLIKIGEL